jgi:hypothetical protein
MVKWKKPSLSTREAVLQTLNEKGSPMSPAEIAEATGIDHGNVRQLLIRMARSREVVPYWRGRYWTERAVREFGESTCSEARRAALEETWELLERLQVENLPVCYPGIANSVFEALADFVARNMEPAKALKQLQGFKSGWNEARLKEIWESSQEAQL